jgi:hypothetical protein
MHKGHCAEKIALWHSWMVSCCRIHEIFDPPSNNFIMFCCQSAVKIATFMMGVRWKRLFFCNGSRGMHQQFYSFILQHVS